MSMNHPNNNQTQKEIFELDQYGLAGLLNFHSSRAELLRLFCLCWWWTGKA
jgi:hypothetical protein